MNEQNLKNLIPFDKWDPDEHRSISSKGGIRSGEARARRKLLRQELEALLSSEEVQERVCIGLIQKAEQGDPRAFMILRDTLGEKLPDGMSIELSGRAADLNAWKEQHLPELLELMREDMEREEPRYEGLYSLLTYEERREALQELTLKG